RFSKLVLKNGNKNEFTSELPLSRKLCYAVGGVPYQMTNIAMGFSLQIFLLDVVQCSCTFHFSLSAVLSMPLAILAYIFLWFIPHNAVSSAFSVPWYLTISCLFETFMSCYSVPCTSLNMFLGGDQQDRDSATAYSENTSIVRFKYSNLCCRPLTLSLGRSIKAPIICNLRLFAYILTVHIYVWVSHQRSAFMIAALVMSALFFVCCMVLFLGVKEQRGAAYSTFFAQIRSHMHTTYLNAVKKLIGHVSYQRLVLGFLFSTLAFQMSLGNFTLFCAHVAGLGAQFQYLMLAILVSATISVPMWQMALVRLGKKTALFISLPLLIPALVVLVAMPENFPVYMVMCVLAGSSLAALFLLPWSMLPDVVDEFTFFSCSRFCNKLGGGLCAGISTMTLHFTGYKAGACSHADGVVLALKLPLAPIPIGFLLVGLVLFYLYPINEVRRKQIQQDLGNTRIFDAVLTIL
uniref:Zgc:171501 n=1 Tax=Sinocyclocheilus rhinocerous TaxID=307959 RepID=A0A673NC32_9TELE